MICTRFATNQCAILVEVHASGNILNLVFTSIIVILDTNRQVQTDCIVFVNLFGEFLIKSCRIALRRSEFRRLVAFGL